MKVLFVGALTVPADGARGGQLTASLNLFNSAIREQIEWIPLSSTMESVPAPPVWKRAWAAWRRLLRFTLLLPKADVALIFAASGMSLIEKSWMAAIGRILGRGVVIRMSGGPMLREWKRNPAVRCALRIGLRSSHVICSQGAFWTRFFADLGAASKVVEAPNPLAIPKIAPRDPSLSAQRLLYAGWVTRDKGVFDLPSMLAAVRAKFPAANLTICGSGDANESLAKKFSERGLTSAVRMRGWVSPEELHEEMQSSDVFVFPSYTEGMPNALLEAMLYGLPVVSTDVGAIPDVVRPGQTGTLVPPANVEALIAAVLQALQDPATALKIAQRARAEVADRHDCEKVWRSYAAALNRAASSAGRACTLVDISAKTPDRQTLAAAT
jgi:glycosyltransferase involved in cell wall biosynthesis